MQWSCLEVLSMPVAPRPARPLLTFAFALPLLGACALAGCGGGDEDTVGLDVDSDEVEALTTDEATYVQEGNEAAFPALAGKLRRATFVGEPGRERPIDFVAYGDLDEGVYQGDILLDPAQLRDVESVGAERADEGAEGVAQQAIHGVDTEYLWPKGIVYYAIDSNLPNKARVTDAIKHWQAHTPIRFVKRTNQPGWVYFTRGKGCSAMIGHTGKKQLVSIEKACSKGSVIHEIGHAVGLWHEQERFDRNDYVSIRWANIKKGYKSNFTKVDSAWSQTPTAYDLGSIMHYGADYFSKNGRATIVRKNGKSYTANRTGLSQRDMNGVEALYAPVL